MQTEVAVVGGGPAGSIFALRMAQLGHAVCLIERSLFPRRHLGESLSPGVLSMLASVGAAKGIEQAATRVHRVHTNWQGEETERLDPGAQGLLVDRGVFDAMLLARAREAGVQVLQPAALRHAKRDSEGTILALDTEEGPVSLRAQFVADASGRSSRLGARRRPTGPHTFAIYGYWRGRNLPTHPRIEAAEHGWTWGVPIPDGSYNTIAFVEESFLRAHRERSLDARLTELLSGPPWKDLLDAELEEPARVIDATPYLDEDCVSVHQIRVGEAALALDPLSSSGVQKAIQTALSGAIVAHTLLRRPQDRELAERFYRERLSQDASKHRAWTEGHYRQAAPRFPGAFWSKRMGSELGTDDATGPPALRIADDVPLQLATSAQWTDTPCLGAEFVELHRALVHPGLQGPVAFLSGQPLAPLLEGVGSISTRELLRRCSGELPPGVARGIAKWLIDRRILEPVESVR